MEIINCWYLDGYMEYTIINFYMMWIVKVGSVFVVLLLYGMDREQKTQSWVKWWNVLTFLESETQYT